MAHNRIILNFVLSLSLFLKKAQAIFLVFFKWVNRWELWFAFVPNMILIIFVWCGLTKTNDQLELLNEQLNTVRSPIISVSFETVFPYDTLSISDNIFIGNIGTDTAKTVMANFELLFINDSIICNLGKPDMAIIQLINSKDNARNSIFPVNSLAPNNKINVSRLFQQILLSPYKVDMRKINLTKAIPSDLYDISYNLKGKFLCFMEFKYHKAYDYSVIADSFYYYFVLPFGVFEDVTPYIGGVKTINRIKDYLQNGPQRCLFIYEDHYELCYIPTYSFPIIENAAKFPRKLFSQ
jgi:hypothetical protein